MRAILTVGGVSIGISSIIFLVSFGFGLEKLVTNQLVSDFEALKTIDVTTKNYKVNRIDKEVAGTIDSAPNVIEVMPIANIPARIKGSENKSVAETLVISSNQNYFNVSGGILAKGKFPTDNGEIVLSKAVLGLINENSQDIVNKDINIELVLPSNLLQNQDGPSSLKELSFKVVGITDNENIPTAYISDSNNDFLGIVNYSAMKVKVNSKDKIASSRQFIETLNLKTEYIGDTVNKVSEVFLLFRVVLGVFGMIALIVASLGTFNILTISLMERIREVGLMKALGMRNKDVYKIFVTESLFIGLLGGIIGLLFGVFFSQGLNFIIKYVAIKASAQPIDLFVTPFNFALCVALFSIVVGFLTGWYPAKRAVKLNPLDALKYE